VLQCAGRVLGMCFGILPWENVFFPNAIPKVTLTSNVAVGHDLVSLEEEQQHAAGGMRQTSNDELVLLNDFNSTLQLSVKKPHRLVCTDAAECTHAQVMMSFAVVFLCTVVAVMVVRRIFAYSMAARRARQASSSTCEFEPIPDGSGSGINRRSPVDVQYADTESSESDDDSEAGEELGMIESLKAVITVAGHHASFRYFFIVQFTGWCAIMYQVSWCFCLCM
jgi:hypothetical protein